MARIRMRVLSESEIETETNNKKRDTRADVSRQPVRMRVLESGPSLSNLPEAPGSDRLVQSWSNNTETNTKERDTEASVKPPELTEILDTGVCDKFPCIAKKVLLCRCLQAKFCSTQCQKENWPEHQEDCRETPDFGLFTLAWACQLNRN